MTPGIGPLAGPPGVAGRGAPPLPLAGQETGHARAAHGHSVTGRVRRASSRILDPRSTGDEIIWRNSGFDRVRWSVALVGFLVYIFVAVTYQLGIADVGMAVALAGLVLLPGLPRVPYPVIGLAGLYLWGWVTWFSSDYGYIVKDELVTLGKLVLIVLVAVNVLRARASIRLYMILFLLFYAAYPARGTIFNYLGGYTHFGRALWNFIYANSNDLAAITLLALSMAAGVLITERNKWFRLGAFAAVIVLTVIILLTKSRGVFLGLTFFAVFALLPQLKQLRRLGIIVMIAGGIAMLTPSDVFERLGGLKFLTSTENLAEVDEERSAEQRYAIWKVSWAIIADHPLTGIGWGAYPQVHSTYAPMVDRTGLAGGPRDTHSTYFNLAAEMGFPGLLIFAALVAGTLLHTQRVRRRCRALLPRTAQQLFFLQVGLLGFLIAGIFASYSRISFLYLHLALMYAMAQACSDDMARLTRAPAAPSRRNGGR
jgi:O-antigen ligase